jgi:hypothetical protein
MSPTFKDSFNAALSLFLNLLLKEKRPSDTMGDLLLYLMMFN